MTAPVVKLRPTFSKLMALVDRLGLRYFTVEIIRRRYISDPDNFTGSTSGANYVDQKLYEVTEYGGYKPSVVKANGRDFARGFSEDSEYILTVTREYSVTVNAGSDPNAEQETLTVTTPGQISFSLSKLPSDASLVEIFINGAKQEYGVDYIASLQTVAYLGELVLAADDVVEAVYPTSSAVIQGTQETASIDTVGQTQFSLSSTPRDTGLVQMFINSLSQQNGTDFSVTDDTVTYLGGLTLDGYDVVEFIFVPSGGGSDFAALEFQNSEPGDQIFYVIQGTGMKPGGDWFTKTSFEVGALTYKVGLKRVSTG